MKNLISILFFFFLVQASINAQWFWQNPLPQGNTLYGVCFTDINTGTAVGGGTILRTTNSGMDWFIQRTGTTGQYLWDVCYTDANNGTAVGGEWAGYSQNGLILHTTNGGTTWTQQTSGTGVPLWGVSFVDASNGTAVGGNIILRTTNGGNILDAASQWNKPHFV